MRAMETTLDRDAVLLPEGTRLVHIGPPKTGTTALQGAFHAARAAAEAQGVHYAGRNRHSMSAVQAVLGRQSFYSTEGPPPIRHWRKLVDEVRAADAKRVVMSSEFFADANAAAIRTVVDDLDASRVHVVVTLRPLARIIPSAWQQYVQSNLKVSFDEWLDAMLNQDQTKISPSFWHRHRHDRLIARWAEVVGLENVTVVVLDERDHGFVLRAFERLTGLIPGTLVPARCRQPVADDARGRGGPGVQHRVPRGGARPTAPQPDDELRRRTLHAPAEPPAAALRVEPPQWAAGQGRRGGARDGRCDRRERRPGDRRPRARSPRCRQSALVGDHQPPITVPPAIAASMAMGVLSASGLATEPPTARAPAGRAGSHLGAPGPRGPDGACPGPTRDLIALLRPPWSMTVRRRLPSGKTPTARRRISARSSVLVQSARAASNRGTARASGTSTGCRVDHDVGVVGLLVGRRDAGEVGDLAGTGAA